MHEKFLFSRLCCRIPFRLVTLGFPYKHEWPWSTQPHRTWIFVVIPVYHPTAMWEARGEGGHVAEGAGAGWLTDRVPGCENGPWQLQCQCVGMCWWGGEEGEVVMVVGGWRGYRPNRCSSAGLRRLSPLTENQDSNWSLQVLCLTFCCAPATVHLTVKTWRVSLKSLFTHFGFRLMCFFFCWQDVSRFCRATMTFQFSPGSHTLMIFIYGNHSSQQSTLYPDILERNLNSASMFWMFKVNKLTCCSCML